MDIKETLKNSTKDLLTTEALTEIENVFNEAVTQRATLQVEAALLQQDDDHAEKVSSLLKAIDNDHTNKLDKIVDAINENHAGKLRQIVTKYESSLTNEASQFKTSVVDSISNYLDLYIEQMLPTKSLAEAVSNKRANNILNEFRKYLSVSDALAKDSIRDAIKDGKNRLDESNKQVAVLTEANVRLSKEVKRKNVTGLLEELTSNYAQEKKRFITRVLSDKTAEFIKENFQYTSDLFDKEQESLVETLKSEAIKSVKSNVDAVIEESVEVKEKAVDADPFFNAYMGELGKY